jgi:hypothetical protein
MPLVTPLVGFTLFLPWTSLATPYPTNYTLITNVFNASGMRATHTRPTRDPHATQLLDILPDSNNIAHCELSHTNMTSNFYPLSQLNLGLVEQFYFYPIHANNINLERAINSLYSVSNIYYCK